MICIIVLLQSIAYIGICQISLAVSYVTIWVYVTVRFIFLEDINPTNKAKISGTFFLALICIFFFQRQKQQIKRDTFVQQLESKEIVSLFHKIMRVYHDGLLITY